MARGHLRFPERLGQRSGPFRGAPRGRGLQPACCGQIGSALRQGRAQAVGQQLGFLIGVIRSELDPRPAHVVRASGKEVGVEVAVDHDVAAPLDVRPTFQKEVRARVPQLAPPGELRWRWDVSRESRLTGPVDHSLVQELAELGAYPIDAVLSVHGCRPFWAFRLDAVALPWTPTATAWGRRAGPPLWGCRGRPRRPCDRRSPFARRCGLSRSREARSRGR